MPNTFLAHSSHCPIPQLMLVVTSFARQRNCPWLREVTWIVSSGSSLNAVGTAALLSREGFAERRLASTSLRDRRCEGLCWRAEGSAKEDYRGNRENMREQQIWTSE